ncbi:helix-turn-helix domain-containing protein [Azorhizobium doebereinerae]|uniref:helix-turn-helix domain-containing protein n=1 Tax=Azorhizobium doebereinerae TaxID=281091 RepID=UPI0009FC47EE|nr:helix-turn-helix transcriptional regulator [Azorhizobium doebereinerae]
MNTDTSELAARIRECARMVGGGEELSRRTGIPRRTLENYLTGREPQASRLAAIADAAGVSLDWLIRDKGPKIVPTLLPSQASGSDVLIDPTAGNGGFLAHALSTPSGIDEELMGRITDAIARLYKDEKVGLAAIDLGRLSGRKYAEITSATDDAQERLAMIKLVVTQLRADLRSAAEAPGSGKRLA